MDYSQHSICRRQQVLFICRDNGKYRLPYKNFLGFGKGLDGLPEIVPEETRIVRWIYYLFLEGATTNAIAATLTVADIPSPCGNSTWYHTSVTDILKNKKHYRTACLQKEYIGDFRTKKRVANTGELPMCFIEYDHAGIVTKEIFDEVQRRLKQPNRASRSHTLFSLLLFFG